MDPLIFVDSNVLLYNLDSRNLVKQRAAHHWMEVLWVSGTCRLSWQVLNEFYANATGKLGADPSRIRASVVSLAKLCHSQIDLPLVEAAWAWMDKAHLSYWDALILAAAEQNQCEYLLTEDFQSNRKYGTVTVLNPFQHAPEEFLV